MAKLGETLRERRVALGISIEEAEAGTKIRNRLLEALEEGAYDRLPNPGYVRGYISSYARFLELEPGPLLNMYKAETGAARHSDLDHLPQTSEAVVPIGRQHEVPWKAGVAVAVVVALLSLGVWAAVRAFSGPEPTPPEPVSVDETTPTPTPKTNTDTTVKPSKPTTETEPATQQPEPQPFTLTVRVAPDGASWLRITVDGKPAYEGTLAGGQEKEYEVASEATVRVGKPEAVTILRDGREVTIGNSGGDVPTVTLVASQTAQ